MRDAAASLEEALDYSFSQPELLSNALTHRSAGKNHNERLEFLGDAVLGAVIADILYRKQPDASEGTLSRVRAYLVRRETLAKAATKIALGDALMLGPGELRSGGFRRESILSDTVEAVIGAVYLDGGFDAAFHVVKTILGERLRGIGDYEARKDAKTALQELLQGRGVALPSYTVIAESGPPHKRIFTVSCEVPALELRAEGVGSSRRRAEQDAAAAVLEHVEKRD